MTNKNTIKKVGQSLTTAGAIALSAILPSTTEAQTLETNSTLPDFRTRVEYIGDIDKSHRIQSTLGLAPANTYTADPVVDWDQVLEQARIYNIQTETPVKKGVIRQNTTLMGFKTPEFKLAEISTKFAFWGAAGDEEGFAIASSSTLGKSTLRLTAEDNLTTQTTRLGFGLDHVVKKTLPNLTVGIGFDRIANPDLTKDQYIAYLVSDLTKNDRIGAGVVYKESSNKSKDYTLGLVQVHHGRNEAWGDRVRIRLDSHDDASNKKDSKSITGDAYLAQHTTLTAGSGNTFLNNNPFFDATHNSETVKMSITKVELPQLYDRSFYGLSLTARGTVKEEHGNTSGNVIGGWGYLTKSRSIGQFGGFQELQFNFASIGNDYEVLNSGIVYRSPGKGNLEVQVSGKIPISGNKTQNTASAQASIQLKF